MPPAYCDLIFRVSHSKEKCRDGIKPFLHFWSEWRDSNSRHPGPKPGALPTGPHPDDSVYFTCSSRGCQGGFCVARCSSAALCRAGLTEGEEEREGEERDGEGEGKGCKEDKPPTRHRFSPPTVNEVREYCLSNGYAVDPDRFVDYYTSNGWIVGKTKMKDWKAAVRTWSGKEKKNGKVESKPLWSVGTEV